MNLWNRWLYRLGRDVTFMGMMKSQHGVQVKCGIDHSSKDDLDT